jgi:hypothetical protein
MQHKRLIRDCLMSALAVEAVPPRTRSDLPLPARATGRPIEIGGEFAFVAKVRSEGPLSAQTDGGR